MSLKMYSFCQGNKFKATEDDEEKTDEELLKVESIRICSSYTFKESAFPEMFNQRQRKLLVKREEEKCYMAC